MAIHVLCALHVITPGSQGPVAPSALSLGHHRAVASCMHHASGCICVEVNAVMYQMWHIVFADQLEVDEMERLMRQLEDVEGSDVDGDLENDFVLAATEVRLHPTRLVLRPLVHHKCISQGQCVILASQMGHEAEAQQGTEHGLLSTSVAEEVDEEDEAGSEVSSSDDFHPEAAPSEHKSFASTYWRPERTDRKGALSIIDERCGFAFSLTTLAPPQALTKQKCALSCGPCPQNHIMNPLPLTVCIADITSLSRLCRFERLALEYDSDEIGELDELEDDPSARGPASTDQFSGIMDEFLAVHATQDHAHEGGQLYHTAAVASRGMEIREDATLAAAALAKVRPPALLAS